MGGFGFPLRIHPCVLNGKPRLLRHILQQLILLNLNIVFLFSQRLNFIATLPASLGRFSCFFPSQYNIKRCLCNVMNVLSICQGSGTLFLTNIRNGNKKKKPGVKREKACVNVEWLLYKLQGRKRVTSFSNSQSPQKPLHTLLLLKLLAQTYRSGITKCSALFGA